MLSLWEIDYLKDALLTYFSRGTANVLGKVQFLKSHFLLCMANSFNIIHVPLALAGPVFVFLSSLTKSLVTKSMILFANCIGSGAT